MSNTLLEKTRRLNRILQQSGNTPVSFSELCGTLSEILDANVYVASSKGKVLGVSLADASDCPIIIDKETNLKKFPQEYNEELLKITETKYNITGDELLSIFKYDIESYNKLVTIVPINGSGQRLGTMVLARHGNTYTDEDLVLAEYSATVVGMEILRSKSEEIEQEARKKAIVQMAIGTLSYSELEAVEHIFEELNGSEGLLVASKIADRVGITRSVIVNALRKFESAGVIESRSLGMKGTHIKILNDKLLDELKNLKK
ncbi:GTP-sensing pleiotropic transcriptional regulator CodY [Paramaledivibacter caminithermalis]|jgi:transcriptional pleiotropic repressor|uniref:Global transcriptional regulator CodY n=1 Tax=Paramaledivibacter caminithermalis (strain DSM 15212 / CIP 107654 / DViRD3) TaxID=1121301 RepID=A0A1M6NL84_PARC5|nr:GTP-sensing pleiotropic transcriptional regulator CodY [Paramaledivibacter caminithermalis]SHJ96344.1 transcriptional pleiotropic repressor [Paramaledivibacter caminithermalis DSM 15212]